MIWLIRQKSDEMQITATKCLVVAAAMAAGADAFAPSSAPQLRGALSGFSGSRNSCSTPLCTVRMAVDGGEAATDRRGMIQASLPMPTPRIVPRPNCLPVKSDVLWSRVRLPRLSAQPSRRGQLPLSPRILRLGGGRAEGVRCQWVPGRGAGAPRVLISPSFFPKAPW